MSVKKGISYTCMRLCLLHLIEYLSIKPKKKKLKKYDKEYQNIINFVN